MSGASKRASQHGDRQRVLDATDIVRLVGEHVSLKPKGREYVGKCPFHDDHKPSMYVVPTKQIYHCFACGAGGNAIDFVMNFHKMEFVDALKHLAERGRVELTPRSPAAPERAEAEGRAGPTRQELVDASRFAADAFRAMLRHEEHGSAARALLERRGVSAAMVEAFEIGASADRWDGLLLTAQAHGVSVEALRALGLVKSREHGGGLYDAFRHRLMFPIHDQLGRVIAFGGRKIREEDDPKYLNSPESALFDKSRTLYGLRQAFRSIQSERRAIVVEGYLDVIACHQAGVTNAVATLGTSLTAEHARALQRMCDTVVLVFDGDDAGARAADRAVEVFFAEPIDVRIATLTGTGAKDPDELLKQEGGRARFDGAMAAARDALEHRFARLRGRLAGAGLSARARMIEEDVARLAELGLDRLSPVRRRLVQKRLAEIAGVGEGEIVAALEARRGASRGWDRGAERGAAEPVERSRALSAAEHAWGALLCEPSLWEELSGESRDAAMDQAYAHGPLGSIARAAAALVGEQQPATLSAVMAAMDDPEARRVAALLAAEVDRVTDGSPERMRALLRDCAGAVARERAAVAARSAGAVEPGDVEGLARRLEAHRGVRQSLAGAAPVLPVPGVLVAPSRGGIRPGSS